MDKMKKQATRLLEEDGELYLWVDAYDPSHSRLTATVFKDVVVDGTRVVFGGCWHYAGYLHGGPYKLVIDWDAIFDGEPMIKVIGNDGELVLWCERISI